MPKPEKTNTTNEGYSSRAKSLVKSGESQTREILAPEMNEAILDEYFLPFSLEVDSSIPPSQSVVIILPGQYEEWRLTELKDVWRGFADIVIIAATRGNPFYDATDVSDAVGITEDKMILHRFAENTRDQMDQVTEAVSGLSVKQVIISTAAYHTPRCVYTFVKSCLDRDLERSFRLAVLPTFGPDLGSPIPAEKASSEIERLKRYQQKGDVATKEEYLLFLET